MIKQNAITFFLILLVAVIGVFLFFQSENTGAVITLRDCAGYAYEHDILFSNTLFMAQGEFGYTQDQDVAINPCTGKEEKGVFEAFVQQAPLPAYGRLIWPSGAIFGFQGSPAPGKGNILYWICPEDETGFRRARVVMYNTEVCNTFDGSYVFDDDTFPRH